MKRIGIKIGIILVVFFILLLSFFLIDAARIKKQEKPLFCIEKQIANDGGTVIFWGLGYKVIAFHRIVDSNEEPPIYYEKMEIGTWAMQYEDFEQDYQEFKQSYESEQTNNEEESSSFYATVLSCNENTLLVEPKEGEEVRKSADKISIGLGNQNDMIYPEGSTVKITYSGYIMETYPAQVKASKIELKSANSFQLSYRKTGETSFTKIVEKGDNLDYAVYTMGSVMILLDGKEKIPLSQALLEKKITMEEIIQKANEDAAEGIIESKQYKDGGSVIFYYPNYTIIKMHTIEGDRDVYIGDENITIQDIK